MIACVEAGDEIIYLLCVPYIFDKRVGRKVSGNAACIAVNSLVVIVKDVENTILPIFQNLLQHGEPEALKILALIHHNSIKLKLRMSAHCIKKRLGERFIVKFLCGFFAFQKSPEFCSDFCAKLMKVGYGKVGQIPQVALNIFSQGSVVACEKGAESLPGKTFCLLK